MMRASAQRKFNAGAQLLQVYSGFIYEGPALISEIIEARKR
jgi:dihydroorotate dehydrogenase